MREINQKRLRYFQEVLVRGSMRGAADALNTAPSVITRQVALLEEEVGFALFERQARGVVPTDNAYHLLEYWRGCQAHQERLVERLQAIDSMEVGTVRIVASEGFVEGLATQILAPFCETYPKLTVELDALPVNELIGALADDSAHIGLAYNPQPDPLLQFVASAAAPTQVLVRAGHPLTRLTGALRLKQLVGFPIALMPPGYGVERVVELLEYAEHLKLHPSFRSNSVTSLKRFVQSTNGVTFVGAGMAASAEIASGELVALNLADPLCRTAQVRLMVRHGRPLAIAASRLLAEIQGRFSVFAP